MARISKYQTNESLQLKEDAAKWKAALYIRLSREDGDKEESDSISNQRDLLTAYISFDQEIQYYDSYVDDGFSGTTFDRPAFTKMMQDIRAGCVNCVVVKDLSRFGRNYIEVGSYLEQIFPFLNIRFISINDTIDSVKNPASLNNLIVPFKNIINDEYCRDISNKIRSSLDMKRKQGKHIGSFALYGFLKDPNDRHTLIVDEYSSQIVKEIYKWFLEGSGIIRVAKRLNEQGVLNPTAYKQYLGLNYRHPTGEKNDKMWCDSSIRRILTNRAYTGALVQGINKIKSYKIQKAEKQPEDKWFIVEDAHEAIIDKETFEKVQGLLRRDTRTSPTQNKVYLFSGFLRCFDCGRAMNRKLISQPYADYHYYVCGTFKKMDKGACTKHTIRNDRLEAAVLATIKQQIQIAVEMDEVIKVINEKGKAKNNTLRLEKEISMKEVELRKINHLKLGLYPDWKNGDISKEEYSALKGQFDQKAEMLSETIGVLHQELDVFKRGVDESNEFLKHFTKHASINQLTRELVIELVDQILIHEGGEITIQFKFQDEYMRSLEFIENNMPDVESA